MEKVPFKTMKQCHKDKDIVSVTSRYQCSITQGELVKNLPTNVKTASYMKIVMGHLKLSKHSLELVCDEFSLCCM